MLQKTLFAIGLIFTALFSFAQPKTNVADDVFQARIANIKSGIELIYHPEVKTQIEGYLSRPDQVRAMVAKSKTYFPIIERALKTKGLPIELKYVAAAASEFNVFAQNNNGASGPWMMMYTVSKMYKGKINSFVDERRDIRKSTQIAVTNLKDLYTIYHQWPLVIAAYAATPVQVNKCIRMANNSLFYWDLHPFLPEYARDLYPKFVATMYIFNHYKDHGIKPINQNEPLLETDSVLVSKWLSFQQITNTLDIPLESIKALNPVFKKEIIPYSAEGYWLYLPKGKGDRFDELKDTFYFPNNALLLDPIKVTKEVDTTTGAATNTATKAFDKKRVYYTVKRGENLSQIANWFDVTASEIKSWNKLKSTKVNAGKKLTIWVPSSKTGYYKRINGMSAKQKKRLK